jgi:cytochrome c6
MAGMFPARRIRRPRAALAAGATLAAAAALAAGCGSSVETSATDGKTIFSEAGCERCHTLSAAGATGRSGPDLDDSALGLAAVTERIADGRGRMPSFRDDLSSDQIDAVARFVVEQRGR